MHQIGHFRANAKLAVVCCDLRHLSHLNPFEPFPANCCILFYLVAIEVGFHLPFGLFHLSGGGAAASSDGGIQHRRVVRTFSRSSLGFQGFWGPAGPAAFP